MSEYELTDEELIAMGYNIPEALHDAKFVRDVQIERFRNYYLNMTPEELREEVAKIGQLRFGYVDWEDETTSAIKGWLEVADQILSLVMAYKVIKEVEK